MTAGVDILRRLTLVAGVLVVGGCDDGAAHIPRAGIVDSAGVRLITYDLTDVSVPTHRIVAGHDLQIGETDGAPEYTFSRIADLALASDGSIIVSDGIAQEIRVYDAAGTHRRTIGEAGQGPGEFATTPTIAGLSDDTLFTFDSRSNRLTSYTLADGRLVEMLSLRSEAIGRPISLIRLRDGTYVSQSRWTAPSAAISLYDVRLDLDSIVVERFDAEGALLDTIRVMADRTQARTVRDGGGGMIRVQQAQTPYTARAVVRSDGVRAILGRSDAFALEMLRPDGATEAVLRILGAQHPATANDIRVHQEGILREDLGDQEIHPMVWRLNIEYLPERLPAFGGVVVSGNGDVWVSLTEYDLSAGLDWLVFSRTGELRGEVHTPPGLRVRQIRDDFIVGFVLDELDVPYVRRYPLVQNLGEGPS